MAIFRFFMIAAATMLYFQNLNLLMVKRVNLRQHARFHDNQSNVAEIWRYFNFSRRRPPPSWIFTRRPASADRTACRQFQATGQPVSQTQASDAMTSRLPRYEAKYVCNAGASNAGRPLCVQISRERSYCLPIY